LLVASVDKLIVSFNHKLGIAQRAAMLFGGIISSPRDSLLPEQALKLANVYLDNARETDDPYIALGIVPQYRGFIVAGEKNPPSGWRFKLCAKEYQPPTTNLVSC
jgi:hypothetical protein